VACYLICFKKWH